MRADLHVHSSASDGKLSPAELVAYAAEEGVTVLGLTDHDSVGGLAEAEAACRQRQMAFVPGLEITSSVAGREAHLLGYCIDCDDAGLLDGLRRLQERRVNRGRETVERLRQLGYVLSWEQVLAIAGSSAKRGASSSAERGASSSAERGASGGSVGRPHVARALIAAGFARDVADAFARFLAEGAPAYVPAPSLPIEESITIVRAAGGVPVLAHPIGITDGVPALVGAGLQGLEVYYGAYSVGERESLAALADGLGLIQTGGSDFHGLGNREGRDLGSVDVPARHVARLLARRAGRDEYQSPGVGARSH